MCPLLWDGLDEVHHPPRTIAHDEAEHRSACVTPPAIQHEEQGDGLQFEELVRVLCCLARDREAGVDRLEGSAAVPRGL